MLDCKILLFSVTRVDCALGKLLSDLTVKC